MAGPNTGVSVLLAVFGGTGMAVGRPGQQRYPYHRSTTASFTQSPPPNPPLTAHFLSADENSKINEELLSFPKGNKYGPQTGYIFFALN